MIRDDIKAALVSAMKGGDKAVTATIRLIQSALKNRDIELRGGSGPPADDDLLVTEVLQKMVKQRRESVALYEQGGRQELADAERAEIAVIEGFLPRQMGEEEAKAAIDAIVAETGASSLKDMGRVMAAIRERHAGQLDMAKASGLVKARLG
ncbi:MAG TPA: GatB/YqeY domain-containing protein [Allosphingosinicella sp.]|nr:GatB/YqeY domain-containing protein [Allosphingosinicella sp.]